MAQTFTQKIEYIFGEVFANYGYNSLPDKPYYYIKSNGTQTNVFFEEYVDENAEDEHQTFEINFGFHSEVTNKVMTPDPLEFPEAFNAFAFDRLSDHPDFAPNILEFNSDSNLDELKIKWVPFVKRFVNDFANIKSNDEGIDICIEKLRFGQLDRYFQRTKDKVRYEKWYRKSNAEEIKAGNINEVQIVENCALAMRSQREIQKANFEPHFAMPKMLGLVCDWVDDMNYYEWMGSGVELFDNGRRHTEEWITDKKISNQFALFASANSDNTHLFVWNKDVGTMPVVSIGEGGVSEVVTASIEDFFELLAIGYCDIGDDITVEPVYDSEELREFRNNRKFRAFYTETFKKEIPSNGAAIEERAEKVGNFYEWLCDNYEPWKEW
jgi:hypothetical protein